MLRTVWFTPTVEEAARGAHWFACVAIALARRRSPRAAPGPVAGVLDSHRGPRPLRPVRHRRAGHRRIPAAHLRRAAQLAALRTVYSKPGPYPGVDAVRSAGQQPCQDAGADRRQRPPQLPLVLRVADSRAVARRPDYGVCWAPG